MSAKLEWRGMTELRQALDRLPQALQQEAGRIVQAAAELHVGIARQQVPPTGRDVTGNLRAGHTIEQQGPLRWRVWNAAPHAWLYSHRHRARGVGPVAKDGTVRGRPAFQRQAKVRRTAMVEALRDLVERVAVHVGLQVR